MGIVLVAGSTALAVPVPQNGLAIDFTSSVAQVESDVLGLEKLLFSVGTGTQIKRQSNSRSRRGLVSDLGSVPDNLVTRLSLGTFTPGPDSTLTTVGTDTKIKRAIAPGVVIDAASDGFRDSLIILGDEVLVTEDSFNGEKRGLEVNTKLKRVDGLTAEQSRLLKRAPILDIVDSIEQDLGHEIVDEEEEEKEIKEEIKEDEK